LRARLAVFISIVQSILFVAHGILYATWAKFWIDPRTPGTHGMAWAFFLLSISFVTTSILSMRYSNAAIRICYVLAAVWLGLVDFLVMGACACWLIWGVTRVAGAGVNPHRLLEICCGAAMATGIYGLMNAAATRVKRVPLRLQHLPERWHGRLAAVVGDLHLGNVRGAGFAQRITRMVNSLEPDIVFIVGDVFDGAVADAERLVASLKDLRAPFGAYFVTGNHEEFGDPTRYIRAMEGAGIRVLANEKISADGLQVFGVNYHTSLNLAGYETALAQAEIDREVASVALVHAPNNLPAAQRAGFSLQISGHTHRGQMFPFTWFTKRVYRQFVYGLHPLQNMFVLTTSGAGTWGPPMRVGTNPEIVLIQFE
jgi:uncharacterized protein